VYSNLKAVFTCIFTSRLHDIALNILSNTIGIRQIIVWHALAPSIIIIFFIVLPNTKLKEIIAISWFQFKFDFDNVIPWRIQKRIKIHLAPTRSFLFDLISRIINLCYLQLLRTSISGFYQLDFCHLLRRRISGFYQIDFLLVLDWWLKEVDTFQTINHFLSNPIGLIRREALFILILVH